MDRNVTRAAAVGSRMAILPGAALPHMVGWRGPRRRSAGADQAAASCVRRAAPRWNAVWAAASHSRKARRTLIVDAVAKPGKSFIVAHPSMLKRYGTSIDTDALCLSS